MKWETVIGLETHIELSTKSKVFCSCGTKFGGEPNTNVCPVCLGHPGVLPSLNRQAVEFTVTAGLSLGCEITPVSYMDRKHYFYPDLPKAFQTSQFHRPLCMGGSVTLTSGHVIRLNHIHLEEDAGKLVHERGKTLVDYNRGGVPLMELVSEPDLRSADEAVEYMEQLQGIMRTAGVSDCRMQEGSMRCGVNVSIRPEGEEKLGTRAEVKNLNSFVSVRQAIEFEVARQIELLENGGKVVQETRSFNAASGETSSMRSKENSDDYRYFREPDIVTVRITTSDIERLRSALPEMPQARAKRYTEQYSLSAADAALLAKYRKVADYYDATVAPPLSPLKEGGNRAKLSASFILTQLFALISTEVAREEWKVPVTSEQLSELVTLTDSGKLSRDAAKRVFSKMLETGQSADSVMTSEGISTESVDVAALCKSAIDANPAAVEDYKNGKQKALQSLIGAVMKASKGQAPADAVRERLAEMLK
ncbi:MAG: Asp-tRNA(Asn)/Glu-tRNA(Gln) amidotransferase subunit GatB [Oscillospiraceae bacterium]|jgi:aspartyl-tRNA(Asn)/glutamyl-tRNA(Gln) amidotransferase subunit B|nr:Asp-tRNA(Asn)/Glu-tRNA(Gln) amidotransferase subunit GatB [Oscillospiraceae bacterium]